MAYGLKHHIDTTGEKFGSAVTIAHLAINSFEGQNSDDLDIYRAAEIVDADWSWELESFEYEYGLAYYATFKDGSKLAVSAWRTEPMGDEWDA